MSAQIFLVAPDNAEPAAFLQHLAETLDASPVAALYLPQGAREAGAYADFARAVIPVAQDRGCAVLLDNDASLAKKLGADGVHVSQGIAAFKAAIEMLKPDMIVGAGAIHARHDAMTKAEAGADYIFFGAIGMAATPEDIENALWWAETFEIPTVLFEASPQALAASEVEFLGLGQSVWEANDGPAKALAARALALAGTQ